MLIVKEGKGEVPIIISNKASEIETFAASELQKYIEVSTETRLSIKEQEEPEMMETPSIILGTTGGSSEIKEIVGDKIKMGSDGFMIKTEHNYLILAGLSERGVLYSVYTFLEKYLGIRWYYPGEDIIPNHKSIKITDEIEEVENPVFKDRYTSFMETIVPSVRSYPEAVKLGKKLFDWMGKNRMNYTFWSIVCLNWDEMRDEFLPEIQKRGIQLDLGGHGFDYWIPRDKYFSKHPEWFPLIAGERVPKGELCLSNEEMKKTYFKNLTGYYSRHPEVSRVSLCSNDSKLFCQCEKCRQLPFEDNLLRLLNRAYKKLTKINPSLEVEHLVYNVGTRTEALGKPKDTEPSEELVIGFAYWGPDYSQVLEFSDNKNDITARKKLMEWLEPDESGKRCRISPFWLYYGSITHFPWIFAPITRTIAGNLRFLRRLGIEGILFHMHPHTDDLLWHMGLNLYLFSRLSWDPSEENRKNLLNDYYQVYYGDKLKGDIRACFFKMEEAIPPLTKYNIPLFRGGFGHKIWSATRDRGDWEPGKREEKLEKERLKDTEEMLRKLEDWAEYFKEIPQLEEPYLSHFKKACQYFFTCYNRLKTLCHQFRAQEFICQHKIEEAKEELGVALGLGSFREKVYVGGGNILNIGTGEDEYCRKWLKKLEEKII